MEKISIFNYEAFYLDFLEGTLSEEDTALLLSFLEKHPDLKLDDESLLTLGMDDVVLDKQFKSDLKHVTFNETIITSTNVEQFLIAESENLLSDSKKIELNQFIQGNDDLQTSKKLYHSVRFVPDLNIHYTDKNALKRHRKIVYWPYVALAAASVAILLFLFNTSSNVTGNGTTDTTIISRRTDDKKPVKKNENTSPLKGIDKTNQEIELADKIIPANSIENKRLDDVAYVDKSVKNKLEIHSLKTLPPKNIENKNDNLELIENTYASASLNKKMIEPEDDYTVLGFNDMNNPIKPITNRLSTAVKQEVDFRTAKANESHSGGFYLKVGKLEISKRKF